MGVVPALTAPIHLSRFVGRREQSNRIYLQKKQYIRYLSTCITHSDSTATFSVGVVKKKEEDKGDETGEPSKLPQSHQKIRTYSRREGERGRFVLYREKERK